MKFGVWPGLGNTTWKDLLNIWQHADSTGWDSAWVADHFMPNQPDNTGPVFESWTMLAALAACTNSVRLGVLVTGNTYRHPAVVAKMAANVDIISNGRLILGMGGAWQRNEHEAYGIPYYTVGQRLRRLDEACQVILSLFKNTQSNFQGRYYQLQNAPLAPKTIQQPHPPLLIGGGGEQITLRIAARYANMWNIWGGPEALRRKIVVLEQRCEEIGRDPAEIEKSANAPLILSDDAEEVERAAAGFGRGFRMTPEEAKKNMLAGTADQIIERVHEYIEAGVDHIIIPVSRPYPVDMLDRFMAEVVSRFR